MTLVRGPAIASAIVALALVPAATSPAVVVARGDLGGSLSFEPNRGQAHASVRFLARGPGYAIALRRSEMLIALGRRQLVRMRLLGSRGDTSLRPSTRLPGKVNYLHGNDPAGWQTGIPTYGAVLERGVYDGIDLRYHGEQGHVEYDFFVQPGADPSSIALRFDGARELRLDATGNLDLTTETGVLRQHAPVLYQQVGGERRRVGGRFVLRDGRVGFAVGRYDRTRTLVIDPTLGYSTYLGGSAEDRGFGIAVDAGSTYVSGYIFSSDFPTTAGAFDGSLGGIADASVTKLDSNGALVYSTYLGGSGEDVGNGIAAEGGHAYVTGLTRSSDFPTANAFDSTLGGNYDAFATRLDSSGLPVYSTYLGGSSDEAGYSVAVAAGTASFTGNTSSTDFPTANAFDSTLGGPADAYVTRLDTVGALAYSTYLGGGSSDIGYGIAVGGGNTYVAGQTESPDFPTANAYDSTLGGPSDGFVTKLDTGGALAYSTYLGGAADRDLARGIAVEAGNAYVSGETRSSDFPTQNAFDATLSGGNDAFAAKLGSAGALAYSTYLGGGSLETAYGIAVEGGSASLTGYTASTDFPTAQALDSTLGGTYDAFVTRLDIGGVLAFSTYLGGAGASFEFGHGIAAAAGRVYVVGTTGSGDFPLANAQDTTLGGISDAFVTRIDPSPTATALRSASASLSGGTVVVRWRTASDLGLAGFRLYRSRGTSLVRVGRLVPSRGSAAGARYSLRDRPPGNPRTTRYWLELIRSDGSSTRLGPITPAR